MMLYRATVSFRSGVENLTAMPTMEAELVSSTLVMKEAVFCLNVPTRLKLNKSATAGR